jgi:ribosomal protein S18 acetylase RimI-like enzyme
MSEIVVSVSSGAAAEAAAALVWARATARRDGRVQRDARDTLPGIRRRLALDGAALLLAHQDGAVVGFAITAPHASTLEVFYLAVEPDAWGRGAGSRLLREVDELARTSGRACLELWVIASNDRAIATYEQAGWTRTGDHQVTSEGSCETRLVRHLAG